MPAPPAPPPSSTLVSLPARRHVVEKLPPQTWRARSTKLAPPPAVARRAVTDAERVALATLEADLGGRAQLVTRLAQAALDKQGHLLVRLLADPAHRDDSLADLAVQARVPLPKVMTWVAAAIEARAQLVSHLHVFDKLPDVTRAVMEDALPGERQCWTCRGLGQVTPDPTDERPNPAPGRCSACGGRGVTPYAPDINVRKTALTLGGLLKPGAGRAPFVDKQVNLHVGGDSEGALDKLMDLTDRLLYGSGRDRVAVVDVEAGDADLDESGAADDRASLHDDGA